MPSQAGESSLASWSTKRWSPQTPPYLPLRAMAKGCRTRAAESSRNNQRNALALAAIIDECLTAGATFARSHPMSHDDEKHKAKDDANRCVGCGCSNSLTP